jgi:hypothetical protein
MRSALIGISHNKASTSFPVAEALVYPQRPLRGFHRFSGRISIQ